MKDAEAKMGDDYEIKAKTGRCQKVKIIGLTEEMTEVEFLHSLTTQNQDLFDGCRVPRVVQKFKTKKSFGVKLEMDGISFKKALAAGRVTIGR